MSFCLPGYRAFPRFLQGIIPLGCRGISRSDFRYDDTLPGTSGLYFLELNNQPGFTPVSLVPEQAQRAGISFGELVTWLVDNATCERRT